MPRLLRRGQDARRSLFQTPGLAGRPQRQPARPRRRSAPVARGHRQRPALRPAHRRSRPRQHRAHPCPSRLLLPGSRHRRGKKKLHAEASREKFAETEAFLAKTKAVLSGGGPGASPEWIEQGLRAALLRDGRRIIAALYNDRSLLPDDGEPLPFETIHRRRLRRIHTLFGRIKLRRNYHHHVKSGTGRCPLDDRLGLSGAFTPAVARLMCRAASRAGSYREAAADLAAYAGLERDPRDLGRLVRAVAPGLREALGGLTAPSGPADPVPVLYVSCDGTGTPMRRAELEGLKGRQEDGTARTREAKLGCVFTQSVRDEEGRPVRDPGSTSYVGTYQGCRRIAVLLHQEARRRGLGRAAQVVYLGDGAAWVWENRRQTFPGAVEILDFYHASEHVGQLAAALHDDDPAEAAACRARWCHDMKQASPAALVAEARAALGAHPEWNEGKREAVQAQLDYLESHATRTGYGSYRAQGWFIGSGVIEAGCKTVVGRRLKQSGMFWSEAGAEDILSLRCLVLGPHFDAAWKGWRRLLAKLQAKARRWSPLKEKSAA